VDIGIIAVMDPKTSRESQGRKNYVKVSR
jgi:hypothetical protein